MMSPIDLVTISPTLGDIAVSTDNGYLAIFSINGTLVGQTTAPKGKIVSVEFSSCPEGTSVNSLLVTTNSPATFTFYCAWDLHLVRHIEIEEITMAEQAAITSQNNVARRRNAGQTQFKGIDVVKASYSNPDSQLIAVLTRNGLGLYANSTPSAQANSAIKNIKVSMIT